MRKFGCGVYDERNAKSDEAVSRPGKGGAGGQMVDDKADKPAGRRAEDQTGPEFRGARVFGDCPDPAVQPACCISFYPPFPTSPGAVAHTVFCYTICGSQYRSPLAIIAQIMRAFLLASATGDLGLPPGK